MEREQGLGIESLLKSIGAFHKRFACFVSLIAEVYEIEAMGLMGFMKFFFVSGCEVDTPSNEQESLIN